MSEHDCVGSAMENTSLRPDDPQPGLAVRCPIDGKCWQYDVWEDGESILPQWQHIPEPGWGV